MISINAIIPLIIFICEVNLSRPSRHGYPPSGLRVPEAGISMGPTFVNPSCWISAFSAKKWINSGLWCGKVTIKNDIRAIGPPDIRRTDNGWIITFHPVDQ